MCYVGDGGAGPYEAAWAELPLFFQWLWAQTYADPRWDLAVHHERAWDAYLQGQLAVYGVPAPGLSPHSMNGHYGVIAEEVREEEAVRSRRTPASCGTGHTSGLCSASLLRRAGA